MFDQFVGRACAMRQQAEGHELWVAVLETAQQGAPPLWNRGGSSPGNGTMAITGPRGGRAAPPPISTAVAHRAKEPSSVQSGLGLDVQEFLEGVGLDQYADCLIQGGFDEMETLVCIEDADMSDLGIPRGHQVKLRKKLREYGAQEKTDGAQASRYSTSGLSISDGGPSDREPGPNAPPHHSSAGAPHALHPHHSSHPHSGPSLPLHPPSSAPEVKELEQKRFGLPMVPPLHPQEAFRNPPQPASPRAVVPTSKMASSVEQSWELVKARGVDRIGQLLFRDLFANAPRTQDLFSPEVRKRYREWMEEEPEDLLESPSLRNIGGKIINAIGLAVAGLQDVNSLVPKLRELGARHFTYGVCDAHLHILGKCLVRVLKDSLGAAFTAEVEFAWTMVYNFISAIMVGGLQVALSEYNAEQDDISMPPTPGRRSSWHETQSIAQQIEEKELLGEGSFIEGNMECYQIGRHLQKAIFGDVFEAIGMSSGRSFAVKALDLDLVRRFERLQQEDHQFCESPLSEVKFAKTMSGLEHVVQMEDEFADQHRHYIVSELALGGDLLECLRLRPGGFPEHQAQILVRGATMGLATLHLRGLAMQDVSVENMLLYELDDGEWQVRICDPGQAVTFNVDALTGIESDVEFHGFVGKEFRPPELYIKQPYCATKVDAWCLGWSTFYLLTAQALFQSADPTAGDPDWQLFEARAFPKLFHQKGWRPDVSPKAKDFILRLMHEDPAKRMSVREALHHPWLSTVPQNQQQPQQQQQSQSQSQSAAQSARSRGREGAGPTKTDSIDTSAHTCFQSARTVSGRSSSLGSSDPSQGATAHGPGGPVLLRKGGNKVGGEPVGVRGRKPIEKLRTSTTTSTAASMPQRQQPAPVQKKVGAVTGPSRPTPQRRGA